MSVHDSRTWDASEAQALDLVRRLQANETALGRIGPQLDTDRAAVFRCAREVSRRYAARFRAIAERSALAGTLEEQARDQREFFAFLPFARELLRETVPAAPR